MAATAPPNAAALAPEWLAHRYDPGHDAVHFVRADRPLRREIAFFTDEYLPSHSEPLVVRRSDALSAAPPPSPIHFIFHSAYCCSTLLANAFERKGAASAFKEPQILNDLVGWRHRGGPPEKVGEVLDSALTLLARPFERGEAAVIKPSNVVNALAPAILALRPEAGCLLIHAPLEAYLGSIARKGLWGRLWVRDLLLKQLKDQVVDLGFEQQDYFLQSDLQVAAVGWLAQHMLFARLASRWPDRVRTLDSEALVARPTEVLAALDRLYGLASANEQREAIARTVFRRHAKFGGAFTSEDRSADQKQAAEIHAEEIGKVAAWAAVVAERCGIAMELPQPLLHPAG